jgi:flagellar protein FliS
MNTMDPRDRYLADAVATATPARLVTMLYERLCRDLRMALDAMESGSPEAIGRHLMHAQDIVIELRSSLKPELWSGGPVLADLYLFLLTELIRANVRKEVETVRDALGIVEGLAEAWSEAAAVVQSQSTAGATAMLSAAAAG